MLSDFKKLKMPLFPNAVAVFTKYPHKGRVKTRLAATIGAEKACMLHTTMAYHALNQAMQLQKEQAADCLVFFHGASEELTRTWLESGLDQRFSHEPLCLIAQHGNDLGARMNHAFEHMYAMGYRKMLLMGTDCPENTTKILKNALNALNTANVVFGPAHDGGYYLIGMKIPHPALFQDIPWSSEDTLAQSLRRCQSCGISCTLLEKLSDIDRLEDLSVLAKLPYEIECHHSSPQ